MEVKFQKTNCSCLNTAMQEVQNQELTQELRLSDSLPDIGRVIGGWGQVILRGKEWNTDSVSMSGGMMVWVLYAPEDGTQLRCIDSWVPFQMKWDLPEDTPEGSLCIRCRSRFIDVRSTSARKMMLRLGVAAMAQAQVPWESAIYTPTETEEEIQLKREKYPMELPREAGEKDIPLDEELVFPVSVPQLEKLVCYTARPAVSEVRVLGNKLVLKGSANVHVCYLSEEGQLYSWDFTVPFSHYAQLKDNHSADAVADAALEVTNLELTPDDEGHLRLKGGLLAQYVICDTKMLELVEDAYALGRDLESEVEQLQLPVVLDRWQQSLPLSQNLRIDANMVVDTQVLPDFPRQRRTANGLELELPGMVQAIYYGEDGALHSAQSRWEGRMEVAAQEDTQLTALPQDLPEPQINLGSGSMELRMEQPVQLYSVSQKGIPMVSGLRLGEKTKPDPNRPSLILQRCGNQSLWELAKGSGSTVQAICDANQLQEKPEGDSLLLIPIP